MMEFGKYYTFNKFYIDFQLQKSSNLHKNGQNRLDQIRIWYFKIKTKICSNSIFLTNFSKSTKFFFGWLCIFWSFSVNLITWYGLCCWICIVFSFGQLYLKSYSPRQFFQWNFSCLYNFFFSLCVSVVWFKRDRYVQ